MWYIYVYKCKKSLNIIINYLNVPHVTYNVIKSKYFALGISTADQKKERTII